MKHPVLLALLTIFTSGQTWAQSELENINPQTYFEPVKLTKEQQPKFKAINMTFVSEVETLNTNELTNFKKLRALNKFRKKRNKSMKSILNSDQYSTWLALQKELEKTAKKEYQQNR